MSRACAQSMARCTSPPLIKPSCEDWNGFYTWIAENEAFDALERRVKKSFITTYMEDNKGELPPGINVTQEYTVTIRRS